MMLTRIDQANAVTTPAAHVAEKLKLLAGEMWRLSMEDPHQVLLVRNELLRAAFDIDACIQAIDVAHAEELARSVA